MNSPSAPSLHAAMSRWAAALGGVLLLAAVLGPAGAADRTPEVLAFGDSITAGFGLPANEAFPARLEARLNAEGVSAHVVNAGVSGDTTADGRARLDWSLA